MKRGVVVLVGVLFSIPLIANAGFDIDPALAVAMSGSAHGALKPAPTSLAGATLVAPMPSPVTASPSATSVASVGPASQVTVGGATPTTTVSVTTLATPSAAWDAKIEGFGRNQPLRDVLSHLVPPGGQLIVTGALPDKRVSWNGSSSRISIARKLLSDAGIDGQFDGNNLTVPAGASVAQVAQVAPVTGGVHSVPQQPVDPSTVKRLWTMPKGVMLSDGLADWIAQTSGWGSNHEWTLDWTAIDPVTHDKVDFKLPAPLRFEDATIDEAAGRAIWLFRKSRIPLAIDIGREQRVLHVMLRGSR